MKEEGELEEESKRGKRDREKCKEERLKRGEMRGIKKKGQE